MNYRPPISQLLLALQGAEQNGASHESGLTLDDMQAILSEAGRFAADRITPLNRIGDQNPAKLVNGKVETPPGWRELYQDWCAAGWNSLSGQVEHGGQGLPMVMAAACTELWNAASMSFALCPLLTTGAIEAIAAHATDDLKKMYLPKMISGEWSGTMNLTEPQAGSDLSLLRCKAKRNEDGSYAISGNKIFITYGEHDFTSNIIHLVLARLEDAPQGTKGISLFLVPKFLPDGLQNDVHCHSLEHKLGIHGSPTCAMVYGDRGGAQGWLIGEENRGLACMFTMMNNARLLVGVQGVALAERATQATFDFARVRKQGRAPAIATQPSAIIHHPDIQRMLLDMRSKTSAARMLCMATAAAMDRGETALASLLTPLAKIFATDIANEVTSTAIQIHGGMGYVEETGVAQFYRDARILAIYEGTNGIQAIDLVSRKLNLDDGKCFAEVLHNCELSLSLVLGAEVACQHVNTIRTLAAKHTSAPNSAQSLAMATPFARGLASLVAASYLINTSKLAEEHGLQSDFEIDMRFFIASELPSALATAQAAVEVADVIASAELGVAL